MANCNSCPRKCNADRATKNGICGAGEKLKIARAAPHFWEEPCISDLGGSGAVFFSGCNLKCVYCQNYEISSGSFGAEITVDRLREIYSELIYLGVNNINLVTPTHYSEQILRSLETPPTVPVVYNSSGYDSVSELKKFEGKVRIYLPDLKYLDPGLSMRYSKAADYPVVAKKAIREMFRQTGEFVLDDDGIMQRGVIIRHLMLPGQIKNTLDVIDWVLGFEDRVIFSLMSQFTPNKNCAVPELQGRITEAEYEQALDYLYLTGLENVYIQDFSSAKEEYTPPFDLSGVYRQS